MEQRSIINDTISFVKDTLKNAEAGHDWWHIERVWRTARKIAIEERADLEVVELAALLHDIADAKFNNGDEEIGPKTAAKFLRDNGLDEQATFHVEQIIRNMSFRSSFAPKAFESPELAAVQDADRLDAIGAIGIARAFTYGGYKNRELYNPNIPPQLYQNKEAYSKSEAPTINHFYEKLLLLKDRMNTATGKRMANDRHLFMEKFLSQFYEEWHQ